MADNLSSRSFSIQALFILSGLLLLLKAGQLQLLESDIRKKANAVAIEKYTQYPSRGLILDRNGKLLVHNQPMYDLLVTYDQIDPAMDTARFCALLDIDRAYFEAALNKDWRSPRFSKSIPFVFLSKISAERFALFQESLYQFPGFEIQKRNARDYPHPSSGHVLGYIREVNQEEVANWPEIYTPGDYIGASGLELTYEDDLRGEKGYRYVLKDNVGRDVGPYQNGKQDVDPSPGRDLVTTLDIDLQQYGEWLMENKIGSIVAIEPSTGEILSMVTTPAYDPHALTITNTKRGDAYRNLQEDPNKPLFDRTIMAQYPPGSLFKPLVALIALQENVTPVKRKLVCNGAYFWQGQRLMGCHAHPPCFDISDAIQYSCNNYFINIFRETVDKYGFSNPQAGLDTFNSYLAQFGMGQKLGIDFLGEKSGNYPTSDYFNQAYRGQRWNSIWIRSLAIGQGELLTSNLQLANIAAAIANRGWYYTPHLVKRYRYGAKPIDEKFTEMHLVNIDQQHFEPVIEGMEAVVTSGTARLAYIPDIPICGKTGTAENPFGEDHSIFFCFAPKDNPQIAIAVYVENAGFGGSFAAPIASLLVEKYLAGEIRGANRQWLETYIRQANFIQKP